MPDMPEKLKIELTQKHDDLKLKIMDKPCKNRADR